MSTAHIMNDLRNDLQGCPLYSNHEAGFFMDRTGGDLCIFLPKVGDFGNTFSVFFNSATQVFRCIVRLYVTCEDSGFLVTARAAEF